MNLIKYDIPETEGKYQITKCGRVFRKEGFVKHGFIGEKYLPEREIVVTSDRDGYLIFGISLKGKKKILKVYRVLAILFVKGRDEVKGIDVVNHINGNKKDNSIENLEWVSIKGNCQHYWNKLKTTERGSKNTDTDLINIYEMFLSGSLIQQIADNYGRSYQNIYSILQGKVSPHIFNSFEKVKELKRTFKERKKFVPSKVAIRKKYIIEGEVFTSQKQIATHYGICEDTVLNRLCNNNFPNWKYL